MEKCGGRMNQCGDRMEAFGERMAAPTARNELPLGLQDRGGAERNHQLLYLGNSADPRNGVNRPDRNAPENVNPSSIRDR